MRTVVLIRHAMPDIPIGERWCVGGRTDLPLGPVGRLQAALLPFCPELKGFGAVYCSPLARALETARAFCPAPTVSDGLREQDMGEWDGLSFAEIKSRFPALYAARAADPSLLPAGAEPEEAVRARMEAALRGILRESEGDIAAVSHKGAIAALTGGRERLSYASLTLLREDNGRFTALEIGRRPHPAPDDAVCLALLKAAGADEALRAHCLAAADLAGELAAALNERGLALDCARVRSAALLHDLAKGHPDHAALGGAWLRELGYPELADIVRQHTDPDGTELSEAALVFFADKAVRGDGRVPVEERFAASLKKCTSPDARAAHRRRLEAALAVQNQILSLLGAEFLQQEEIL